MVRELSLSVLNNNGNICAFMYHLPRPRPKATCFMHIISSDRYEPP